MLSINALLGWPLDLKAEQRLVGTDRDIDFDYYEPTGRLRPREVPTCCKATWTKTLGQSQCQDALDGLFSPKTRPVAALWPPPKPLVPLWKTRPTDEMIKAIKDNNGVDSQLYHSWCAHEATRFSATRGCGFKLVEALVARKQTNR